MTTSTRTSLPTLTSTDTQALRVCSLAIGFSCATHPLSSAEVHAAYYPDTSEATFSRAFRRDRMRLAACGIPTWDVGDASGGHRWVADMGAFADGDALSAEDALLLCALCQQLVDDEAFPSRFELRHALAKVARSYRGVGAVRLPPADRGSSSVLACLLRCLAEHQLVRIAYTDAAGHASSRVVAPYGSFGLRGILYLVCATDGGSGDLRTFRVDRVASAEALDARFSMPEDFSIDDHILLPFQIGPTVSEGVFLAAAGSEAEGLLWARGHRSVGEDWRAGGLGGGARATSWQAWSTTVSDLDVAASWAIALDARPVAPRPLVRAWRSALAAAGRVQRADAAQLDTMMLPARRARCDDAQGDAQRGRRGGLDEARELIALVGALGSEGDTVTTEAVAARLGITHERATTLLNLLLMVGGDGLYLPLSISDDEQSVTLAFGGGLHGRPLRLTSIETQALIAALDATGVAKEDPLRRAVLATFSAPGVSEDDVRRSMAPVTDAAVTDVIALCARAIVDDDHLAFSYRGVSDAAPRPRRTAPTRLERHDAHWYLVAHDLDRAAERSFRLDRMADVVTCTPDSAGASAGEIGTPDRSSGHHRTEHGTASTLGNDVTPDGAGHAHPTAHTVTLVFANERHLSTLAWPDLHIVSHDSVNGVTVAETPWYGGEWLPRHLAACGGEVTSTDADLVTAVRSLARSTLQA